MPNTNSNSANNETSENAVTAVDMTTSDLSEQASQTTQTLSDSLKASANEVVVDGTRSLRQATEDLAENASTTGAQASEQVREIARQTSAQLEATTNQTLSFLGIPIDVNTMIHWGMDWGGRLVLAMLIFFIGKWVGKRLVNVLVRLMNRTQMDETAASFLSNVLYGLMLVMVTLAALNKLGINTNSFVAVLGAIGVAIGVALKDQIGNLAAGVMIVIFRPFRQGDFVEIGGKVGTVIDIALVNTRIRTANNHEIIIPNGDIMTTASINYSSLPNRRLEIAVGIGYDSDIRQAKKLMLEISQQHAEIFDDPEPVVRVTDLGDNAVVLTLYAWTANNSWWATQCDILESIKYAFDEARIDLPFPQRTVHIEGLEGAMSISEQTKSQNIAKSQDVIKE